MTSNRFAFLPGLLALGIASCAPTRTEPQAAKPAAEAPPVSPEFKKKPRLNGRGKVSSISLTEAFALQQNGQALIYDARPTFFYQMGHIPGAIHLPKTRADAQIHAREQEIKDALAAGKTIIVYCTNFACPDARTVAIHLAGFGYSSSTLTGGWDAWKESGLPTE